jgi:FkbM family methyltransferase
MRLLSSRYFRTVALKTLKIFSFDFSIRHHWVEKRFIKLNSFKHKGYWWYGRKREEATLKSVADLILPGQTVVELGAHIGYLTLYFSHLVGSEGRVIAFEPSEQNREYLEGNIRGISNVAVEPVAISDFVGAADLFVEDLTGQNTSLVESYEVLGQNEINAGIRANIARESVPVTTLDAYCEANGVIPNFIKIDVEGAEEAVLRGSLNTMRKARPVVLIEITRRHGEVYNLLRSLDYSCFDDELRPAELALGGTPNYFWIPSEATRNGPSAR